MLYYTLLYFILSIFSEYFSYWKFFMNSMFNVSISFLLNEKTILWGFFKLFIFVEKKFHIYIIQWSFYICTHLRSLIIRYIITVIKDMPIFKIFKLLYESCTISYCLLQCIKVPNSLHLYRNWGSLFLFFWVFLTSWMKTIILLFSIDFLSLFTMFWIFVSNLLFFFFLFQPRLFLLLRCYRFAKFLLVFHYLKGTYTI